jgi:hypothetical protein
MSDDVATGAIEVVTVRAQGQTVIIINGAPGAFSDLCATGNVVLSGLPFAVSGVAPGGLPEGSLYVNNGALCVV